MFKSVREGIFDWGSTPKLNGLWWSILRSLGFNL